MCINTAECIGGEMVNVTEQEVGESSKFLVKFVCAQITLGKL